jgi:hypothetical protein
MKGISKTMMYLIILVIIVLVILLGGNYLGLGFGLL